MHFSPTLHGPQISSKNDPWERREFDACISHRRATDPKIMVLPSSHPPSQLATVGTHHRDCGPTIRPPKTNDPNLSIFVCFPPKLRDRTPSFFFFFALSDPKNDHKKGPRELRYFHTCCSHRSPVTPKMRGFLVLPSSKQQALR